MSINRNLMAALVLLALLAWPAGFPAAQSRSQSRPAAGAETDATLFGQIVQSPDPISRLELVEKFLSAYPESPYRVHTLVAGAEAHRMQNHFEEAITFGDNALALDPNNAVALLLVAEALSESSQPNQADFQARLTKAQDYSTRALKAIPMLFSPEERKESPSPEEFDLREDFFESLAHATLGYVHYRREELPAAEQELKLATELNQLQPNAVDFERLGIVQVRQRKFDPARDSFLRCVEVGGPAGETCKRRIEMLEQIVGQEQGKEADKPQE